MNKPNIAFKTKSNPLLDGLSDYLKDPKNFESVQKQILESIMTTCSHSDMAEFATCSKCSEKMLERRKLMKKLGFKSPRQYMAWKQVHTEIKKRYPLVDWNQLNYERRFEGLK